MGNGALTNENGLFSISGLAPGSYRLVVAELEMDTLYYDFTVAAGQVLNVNLRMKPTVTTGTVVIQADQATDIQENQAAPGLREITPIDIKRVPSLGTDLGTYLQTMPGVVFTGDQGGQLFIRGGTPSQNLVLMDGAIMYNPFHTLGIFCRDRT